MSRSPGSIAGIEIHGSQLVSGPRTLTRLRAGTGPTVCANLMSMGADPIASSTMSARRSDTSTARTLYRRTVSRNRWISIEHEDLNLSRVEGLRKAVDLLQSAVIRDAPDDKVRAI